MDESVKVKDSVKDIKIDEHHTCLLQSCVYSSADRRNFISSPYLMKRSVLQVVLFWGGGCSIVRRFDSQKVPVMGLGLGLRFG